MNSRVLYLSHTDSIDIHERNTPSEFVFEFERAIQLNISSTIELIEFKCKLSQKLRSTVYVFSDICDSSTLAAREEPLLRAINLSGLHTFAVHYDYPITLKTVIGRVKRITIYLKNKDRSELSFNVLNSEVTLLLKNVSNT